MSIIRKIIFTSAVVFFPISIHHDNKLSRLMFFHNNLLILLFIYLISRYEKKDIYNTCNLHRHFENYEQL